MASVLDSSDEKTNGFKLMRLIVDGGTEALRQTLTKYCPGNLQVVLSTHHHTFLKLKHKKIINQNQWDKLYPAASVPPKINDFDITLLCVLLKNICGLKSHRDPIWHKDPNVSDHSVEADIVRVRSFRNERFGHIPNTAVSDGDFQSFWAEISIPLVRLGIDQREIDRLESEPCGKEEVERVLKEWEKSESEITKSLKRIRAVVDEVNDNVKALRKDNESRSDELLNKHLVWCNFQTEIELYCERFTEGTREWVFEEFLTWFDDENSKNRAFVISGLAGMGKSVVASAMCKKFAEHVAACHFFQYNNSKYNNPKFFLQSVAWQVSQVFPAYKKTLIDKLSGNLGQSLNDMNIQALFSTLFKEPLSDVDGPGKPILIVLDALDESSDNERDELVHLISHHLHKLPSYIRFVITTRPEKSLIDRLEKLNPLYIRGDDPRNLHDLKMVLQERILEASPSKAELIDRLAEKSDGLMLYSFFLSEIYNDDPSTFAVDNLPNGIGEHYEGFFRRLEGQLGLLEISDDKFVSLLSALAVSKEPLPDAFVQSLLGVENSPRRMQKVRKAISCLIVINEDKSISFFHKSFKDWLVDHWDHDYSVDVQYGHKILFDLCVSKLDELKVSGVTDLAKSSAAIRYSVKHWISHMLNGPEDPGKLESLVSNYAADVEVMFASVCFDVDLTLNSISNLTNYKMYNDISESTKAIVAGLFLLIRRFSFFLRDYPHTFLQNVVNEGGEDLSLKASSLLQTRYKEIVYLEFIEKDRKHNALECRRFLSGAISGIDISPKHDYIVCSYREGGIELFSTATLMSVWKKPDVQLELPPPLSLNDFIDRPLMLRHCIVFHPGCDLILPGRLDEVLSIEGKLRSGPFQWDESCSRFTNCCFSLDNSRMVTNYGNNLIVWNVASGDKIRCLPCKPLFSFSFTASGNFLGTVDTENVFNVYDINNDCTISKCQKLNSESPVEILSMFEQNSWFCLIEKSVVSVDENVNVSRRYPLSDIILPSSLHYCDELICFLHDRKQSWFSKVREFLKGMLRSLPFDTLRYILIGDESVLIYSCPYSNAMHIFSIKSLVDEKEQYHSSTVFSTMSLNGDFAYLSNWSTGELTIYNILSNTKLSKSFIFSPIPKFLMWGIALVRDGVILCNENRTPELWNNDVTQCLASFDVLVGMKECFPVSDEVIACEYDSYVTFFNVFTKKIESKTSFNEKVWTVLACSIKYHVLAAKIESMEFSLWKNGVRVDGWENVFRANTSFTSIFVAEFSPQGSRLALFGEARKIFIFDVVSLSCVVQVPIYWASVNNPRFKFFDNENLVCGFTNHTLCFINVDSGEIITCLDMGNIPSSIDVSRKRSIVCAGIHGSERVELIKVCLPR